MNQAALVIVKPDGMTRGLLSSVLDKFAQTKLDIIGMKSIIATEELAREHYNHLKDKDFFNELIDYLTGKLHQNKNMIAVIYYGEDAIAKCRGVAGATHPEKADPWSIRGAFGRVRTDGLFENVVHVSSDDDEAEREIKLWFSPEEVSVSVYPTDTRAATERTVWV